MHEAIEELIKKWEGEVLSHSKLASANIAHDNIFNSHMAKAGTLKKCIAGLKNLQKQLV